MQAPTDIKQSLADKVYDQIKTLILCGELGGGERIPEEGLAERFGLSRTPVREALRRLEEYGLVLIKPRSYAEVVSLSSREAEDITTVRLQLETLSVRLLAQRADTEDAAHLSALAAECLSLLESDNVAAVFEADSRFHLAIAHRSRNLPLYHVMERFDAKVQLVRLMRCRTQQTIAQNLELHEEIVDAIQAHDAEHASQLMNLHVLGFKGRTQP